MTPSIRRASAACALGIALGWAGAGPALALAPRRAGASEIQLALKKLQVLASALYVAAHPDDENTRLIAWLAEGRLADTAYLSMTRGDGGQNLIGPEIGELLGVIRSQELLAARRIDGGRQFFTRAIDFGFSKSPEETLRFWDREQVLADTVRIYRQFQPDVVITRFPAGERETHGHHTASAWMARDAMAAAGDAQRFPEQLDRLTVWRPRRMLWNTSRFFYDKPEDFKPEGLVAIDVGVFSPLLGESFTERAARSRSMHKSQGFGSSGQRGEVLEYLAPLDSEAPPRDLFDGIDTTWARIPGGKVVGDLLAQALREFVPEDPAASVPRLLEARARLTSLPPGRWKEVKQVELDRVIAACLGLYLEAVANTHAAAPGDTLKINLEVVNRSTVDVRFRRVVFAAVGADDSWEQDIQRETIDVTLPSGIPESQPYWLRERGTVGTFRVDDPALIGLPENPPALTASFMIKVAEIPMVFERPVVFKKTDPVHGEQYRPFEVIPAVAVEIPESVFVLPPERASRPVKVELRAGRAGVEGTVRLETPAGWSATPASHPFRIEAKDATTTVSFDLAPPATGSSTGAIRAVAEAGGRSYRRGIVNITHDHIPPQIVMPAAEARVVRADLRRRGESIGYVQGAGDQVPAALREIGYAVTELTVNDLNPERLRNLDAVVLGVRAYNTLDRIRFQQAALFDYVRGGGTLIVQYATAQGLKVDAVAPLPLTLSRERVSEEDAEVRFLAPDHPILNTPNRIAPADFEGWVQERGLYFADTWDPGFTAVLSSNDAGEPARDGGLLVARHGEGWFVYTGYSFFRQLPAGVPGAYRLFANLIALGN